MWRKRTGLDSYEKRIKFGLSHLRLIAEPTRWTVTGREGTPIMYGVTDSLEASKEQAVAATLTTLRDARKLLEQEIWEQNGYADV